MGLCPTTLGMGWIVCGACVTVAGLITALVTILHSSHVSCVSADAQGLRAGGEFPHRMFSLRRRQALREVRRAGSPILDRDGFVDSVSRSRRPSLDSRSAVSVPQTIWQTARSHEGTPEFGTDLYNSWTRQNPQWDHFFMDDKEVDAFVAEHYNETVLKAFREMPLGVMRADAFRCARRRAPLESVPKWPAWFLRSLHSQSGLSADLCTFTSGEL